MAATTDMSVVLDVFGESGRAAGISLASRSNGTPFRQHRADFSSRSTVLGYSRAVAIFTEKQEADGLADKRPILPEYPCHKY